MSELHFEFELEGRTVRPGQVLYVAPSMWWRAGPKARVERYYGDSVMLRTDEGAVPTVPLDCLSWEPHPETVAMDDLREAGFTQPTRRDVSVWMAARQRTPAPQPLTDEDIHLITGHCGVSKHAAVSIARAVEAEVLKRMGVKQAAESETPNAAGKAPAAPADGRP